MLAGALHLKVVIPRSKRMCLVVETNLEAAIVTNGARRALLEDELARLSRLGAEHGSRRVSGMEMVESSGFCGPAKKEEQLSGNRTL